MIQIAPGDLIGFSHWGLVGSIINFFTYGIPFLDLSHIGVVAEYEGQLLLFESTTLNNKPCFFQKKPVSGVQAHPLDFSGYGGYVYHIPVSKPLTAEQSQKLTNFCLSKIGTEYDLRGATSSGGLFYSKLKHIARGEDLRQIFCSEFCHNAHKSIGVFPGDWWFGNSSYYNPNRLYRIGKWFGYYKHRQCLNRFGDFDASQVDPRTPANDQISGDKAGGDTEGC